MAVEIRYSGQVVKAEQQRGSVTARSPSWKAEAKSGVLVGGVPYDGSYEATPTMEEQVLHTRSKTMRDDVTVHAIPYTQTTNPSGGYTAIIAAS